MSFEPYQVEAGSLVNSGGGPPTHFTDGAQYLWECTGVRPSAEDANGTGFNWMLVAKDGPDNIGGTLRNYTSVSEKSRSFLAAMVEVVGLKTSAVETLMASVADYKKHAAVASVLDTKAKGKQFCSLVVDEVSAGYTNSKLVISSFLPAKDFVKATAAPKAVAAPKAAAPAAAPAEPPAQTDEDLAALFDKMAAEASA